VAANDNHGELIIVKRHDDGEHEHHSSAWKVAHADFMTAMMAFFLIMWLVNVTDKDTRKAIANYFNPVNLASSITDVKGLNDPEKTIAKSASAAADKHASGKGEGGGRDAAKGDAKGAASEGGKEGGKDGGKEGSKDGAGEPLRADSKEIAAFQDPYATLKKLDDEAQRRAGSTASEGVGQIGSRGTGNGDLNRDPFDPASWQPVARQAQADKADAARTAPPPQRRNDAPAPRAGDNAKAETPAYQKAGEQLEAEIKSIVSNTIGAQHAPKVNVRTSVTGFVIDVTDDIDYSMFPVGSAVPDARFVRAMAQIAKILKTRPGEVYVRGHTDARPFRSETYDNWRLSSARAQMTLYMLVRGGLDEKRVMKIEGVADRELKNTADPNAAENRRIEILLRSVAP